MADVLQIVTLSADGTTASSVTGGDLNGTDWSLVRDTLKLVPGQRNQQFADTNRRYGGSVLAAETHANGTVTASLIYAGSSANAAVTKWEQLLGILEDTDKDYYLKWQPENATNAVYYQIKGPASWQANYRWIEFSQNKSIVFEVSWPIGPLGRGLSQQISALSTTTYPASADVSVTAGTAPGLLDLQFNTSTAANWMLASWSTVGTPQSNTRGPFGALALTNSGGTAYATGVSVSGTSFGFAAESSTTLVGGKVRVATPTASTYTVNVDLDPSTLKRDSFNGNDVSLEVWARMKVASDHIPTTTTSLAPTAGTNFGDARYTAEYGTAGKLLTKPSSGSNWYFYRLGTVPAYVDPSSSPAAWRLSIATAFSAASSNEFAIDYVCVVPARQRALSPTAKTPNSSYPVFIPSSSGTAKIIRSNLTGWMKSNGGTNDYTASGYFPDSGLGGQLLEVPAASSFKLFLKSSAAVPDDPAATNVDTVSQSLTVSGWYTPRYYLARGA
jgi:hypothetical protein